MNYLRVFVARSKGRKHSLRGGALALLLAALATGCKQPEAPRDAAAPEAPMAVKTTPALAVQVPDRLDLDGTLEALRRARLSPRISGHVAEVLVDRGSVVQAGDTLIKLRPGDFELQAQAAAARVQAQRQQLGGRSGAESVPEVVAARLDWEGARDYLARVRPLHESGAMDDLTFEQAERREAVTRAMHGAARQRAQAGFATLTALSAEAELRHDDAEKATVTAPFAGTVVSRSAEVGEFVGPQTPVVELVDGSQLKLILEVPERAAAQITAGLRADIEVDGGNKALLGKVEHIAGALDPTRRTLTIEVYAPNPDGALRPGHFARARIHLGGARAGIQVPASALTERAGVFRVYVVRDAHAEAEIVQVIERHGESVVVEGNVKADEAIVVTPPHRLADGSAVTVGG